MEVVAYVLRRGGHKLHTDVVRKHPLAGWLFFGEDNRKVTVQIVARLYRDKTMAADILEPMVDARVQIRGGGIMILGFELGREARLLPQAWWCLPGSLVDGGPAG